MWWVNQIFSWKCVWIGQSAPQCSVRAPGKGLGQTQRAWKRPRSSMRSSSSCVCSEWQGYCWQCQRHQGEPNQSASTLQLPVWKCDTQRVRLAPCATSSIQNRKHWNQPSYRTQTSKIMNWFGEGGRKESEKSFILGISSKAVRGQTLCAALNPWPEHEWVMTLLRQAPPVGSVFEICSGNDRSRSAH